MRLMTISFAAVSILACKGNPAASPGSNSGLGAAQGKAIDTTAAALKGAPSPLGLYCESNGGLGQSNVALTMVVLSLHHSGITNPCDPHKSTDIPDRAAIGRVAQRISKYMPDPANLVIVMPAAPYSCDLMVASSGLAFFTDLTAAYGDPVSPLSTESPHLHLTYATDAPWSDWNIAGVIAGANYHIDAVERPVYPANAISNITRFGDFTLSSGSMTFHVLAVQTTSDESDNNARKQAEIDYAIDYGASHRGSEPSFVVGDFNNDETTTALMTDVAMRGNFLTCEHACENVSSNSHESKLHIFRIDSPTTLRPIGLAFDPAQLPDVLDTAIKVPELGHWPVAASFAVSAPHVYRTQCTVCPNAGCRPACGAIGQACCENTCDGNGVCSAGMCAPPPACGTALVMCKGQCVSLGTNSNCTRCGDRCGSGKECASELAGCVVSHICAAGQKDCGDGVCVASSHECP